MTVLTLFDSFMFSLGARAHDLRFLDLRFVLTNTAPDSAWDAYEDVEGELPTGGGYTTGGIASELLAYEPSNGGVLIKIAEPPKLTGAGDGFGPARYIVAFNAATASDLLIGWADTGASFSRLAGEELEIALAEEDGCILELRLAVGSRAGDRKKLAVASSIAEAVPEDFVSVVDAEPGEEDGFNLLRLDFELLDILGNM